MKFLLLALRFVLTSFCLVPPGNITDKVGDFCGNSVPSQIRTSDSRAYFKFVSNAQDNFRGFSFNFLASVDCKFTSECSKLSTHTLIAENIELFLLYKSYSSLIVLPELINSVGLN